MKKIRPHFRTIGPRRHMQKSQWAMVAARMKEQYAREAKERLKTSTGGKSPRPREKVPEPEAGRARDKAGEAAGDCGDD